MADYTDKLTLAAWNALGNAPGTVKLVWGEYTGTGECGAEHPNTLTFDGRPLRVIVWQNDTSTSDTPAEMLYGVRNANPTLSASPYSLSVSWTESSVSWWYANSAYFQFNSSSLHYCYVAWIGN